MPASRQFLTTGRSLRILQELRYVRKTRLLFRHRPFLVSWYLVHAAAFQFSCHVSPHGTMSEDESLPEERGGKKVHMTTVCSDTSKDDLAW